MITFILLKSINKQQFILIISIKNAIFILDKSIKTIIFILVRSIKNSFFVLMKRMKIVEAAKRTHIKEGYILTFNEDDELSVEDINIKIIPAWKWLLKNI